MGLGAALLLALPCLCAGLGAWLWLSTRYLQEERVHLQQRPALVPLYCAALLSAATKPRRLSARAALQRKQITMGATQPSLVFKLSCAGERVSPFPLGALARA